jgi:hypothetical protein
MNNDLLMRMTTTMRVMMRIVMTMSLNLKVNARQMCLHRENESSRKVDWNNCISARCDRAWERETEAKTGNETMAVRGALSGENGLFVSSTVDVTKQSKAMGCVRLTVAESDANTQVGVTKESKAMGFVRLTVAESDASIQVGVERVLWTQLRIALLTAGASDANMQVGVERVANGQLRIALLMVGASDASMQAVVTI